MSNRASAVIVLAAGEGTRMRSAVPKVLHQISGRSLLGHALVAAAELQPERLAVVVRHQRDVVAQHVEDLGYDALIVDQDEVRSEEHTSELQSRGHLVCRLLLEKK